MSDRTPGRDTGLAGAEASMERAAKFKQARANESNEHHEAIKATLGARPSNVVYLAEWRPDAKLAYGVASDAALAPIPEDL